MQSSTWDGAALVLGALDTVSKKRKLDPTQKKLHELITLLEGWVAEDAAEDRDESAIAASIGNLRQKIDAADAKATLQAHHKEVIAAASKLSKVADKAIGPSVECAVPAGMTLDAQLMHEAVYQHLLVAGQFNVAESFRAACELEPTAELSSSLEGMHRVRAALERGETAALHEWLAAHQKRLPRARAATLMYELRQLEFATLLHKGDARGALQHLRGPLAAAAATADAETAAASSQSPLAPNSSAAGGKGEGNDDDADELHVDPRAVAAHAAWMAAAEEARQLDLPVPPPPPPLPPSSSRTHPTGSPAALRAHNRNMSSPSAGSGGGGGGGGGNGAASSSSAAYQLRKLSGALAFAHRLDGSPYAKLLDTATLSARLAQHFESQALALLELPPRSALQTCVHAGSLSLPRLAKLASVLKGKYVDMYKSGQTLPLDLDLGTELTFHSTFTCPISKELATPGNPPMLLPCGHVLALGSVTKLARGSRSARFKCPYCPNECTISNAQALTI